VWASKENNGGTLFVERRDLLDDCLKIVELAAIATAGALESAGSFTIVQVYIWRP
jgi:hypothetical protein